MNQVKKPKTSFSDWLGRGIDSVITVINPRAGLARFQMRMAREILAGSKPYRGAQKNRFNKDWVTSGGSADEDMLYSLTDLRERSRELVRNDTHAAGIILTLKTNVIGTGIKPQASVDWEALGITSEKAEIFETLAEEAFNNWIPFADAQGRMDFFEIQNLVAGQIFVNGDVLVLETRITDDPNRPYWLAYEVIESDRLATPPEFSSDENVRQGVRLGSRGQPIGYYVCKQHPADTHFRRGKPLEYIYYPLHSPSGRKQVYHLYDVERPGQSRGLPILTPAIEYFHHKAKYLEAEVVAARVAACLVAAVTKENAFDSVLSRTQADTTDTAKRLEKMSPGKFEYLQPGEKLEVINPNRPGNSFEPFISTIIRSIASSIGIPYELVAKDFSKANYSSMRSALIEARRYFLKIQVWLQRKYLHPCYQALLEEAFLRGELDTGMQSVRGFGFYEKFSAWTSARWVAQGWPWVDPKKEVEASAIAIEKGLSTASREAAHQGRDFYEMVDERVRELKYIEKQSKKYGIDLFALNAASNAGKPASNPAEDPDEDEEPDPEEDDEPDPEEETIEGEQP